jgi:hypothetical protein
MRIFSNPTNRTLSANRAPLLVALSGTLMAIFVSACTQETGVPPDWVPNNAQNVASQSTAANEAAVSFHMHAARDSYTVMNYVKAKIIANNFSPCEKSAAATWQNQAGAPTGDLRSLVETFDSRQPTGADFVTVRIDQSSDPSAVFADQNFTITLKHSPSGSPDSSDAQSLCKAS